MTASANELTRAIINIALDPKGFAKRLDELERLQSGIDASSAKAAQDKAAADAALNDVTARETALATAIVTHHAEVKNLDEAIAVRTEAVKKHLVERSEAVKALDERAAALNAGEQALAKNTAALVAREAAITPREQAADDKAAQAQAIIDRARALVG